MRPCAKITRLPEISQSENFLTCPATRDRARDPPEPRSRGGDRRPRLRLAGCHHYIGADGIVARRGRFRFLLGIGDAAVEHRHESKTETLRNYPHIAQSQIAFVELMIADALVDDVVNQLFDLR